MRENRPIKKMLENQKKRRSFHMPGHQNIAPYEKEDPYQGDTTELGSTDDLYHPRGAIQKAEERIAHIAKAERTILLTGGATAGVLAMMLYALAPNEQVILPRTAHKSMIHGCILSGATPIYVYPRETSDHYFYYTTEDYLHIIKENSKAKAVMVTRPDYYGHLINLKEIVEACKKTGQLLLVDEAHGAHLNWMEKLEGAGSLGADIWVQSAHKTLPVLTGGAWLHSNERIDSNRLRQKLQLVHTSSPSFLIMKSLDDGRNWMEEQGKEALKKLEENIQVFFHNILKTPYHNAHTTWEKERLIFDGTRMVITAPQGGFSLASSLEEKGIDVELADEKHIVCIPSVMTQRENFDILGKVLYEIEANVEKKEKKKTSFSFHQARQIISPREAVLYYGQWISLKESVGKIAAAAVGLYPPGVPWLLPGEEITGEIIKNLLKIPSKNTFGVVEGNIYCVK